MDKNIEKDSINRFYVIVAERDGVKKYVSRDFPRLFQYTIKISKARRFNTKEKAHEFVDQFKSYREPINNPEVKEVIRKFELAE